MILTATQSIERRQISQYPRIVSAEAIPGVNLFKDLGVGFRNLIGGRSETHECELGMARGTALAELYQHAKAMGADAAVGVDIDYEVPGADNGIFMVTASGIAVTLVQVTAAVLKPRSGAQVPPTPL